MAAVVSGTEGGVRLYLTELVELTESTLQSQSWLMKAQAAAAMSTIANKLDASLGPPHLGLLLTALTNGLAGRTWAGKVDTSNSLFTLAGYTIREA